MKKSYLSASLLFTFFLFAPLASSAQIETQPLDQPTFELPVELTAAARPAAPKFLQNRIKVGWNDGLYAAVMTVLFDVMAPRTHIDRFTGYYTLGYRRMTNTARWALGVDVSYMRIGGISFGENTSVYHYFLVLPTAEVYYKKRGICRLYGSMALGVMFAGRAVAIPAFQIHPIGVRVGNDRIAGFVELGLGFRNLIGFGLEVGF